MTGWRRWGGILGLAWALAPPRPAVAQLTATLDAGASVVEYEGFLPSGSVFVIPSLRADGRTASFAAQGTYLRFESGNQIFQGAAAGAWFPGLRAPVRPELSGSVGLSGYADEPVTGHALARARLHLARGDRGAWLGAALGRSLQDGGDVGATELSGGAWWGRPGVGLSLSALYGDVPGIAYADVTANARVQLPRTELEGSLGARLWSRATGQGAYAEVAARLLVSRTLGVVASGGRYPSDPVRGTLAGTYLSLGLRLQASTARRAPSPELVALLRRMPVPPGAGRDPSAPALTVGPLEAGLRTLRVYARDATSVELAGDFTDWQPVSLRHTGGGAWEILLLIPEGVHRVSVRVDGGPWLVPAGVRSEPDEFGGRVGVLPVY